MPAGQGLHASWQQRDASVSGGMPAGSGGMPAGSGRGAKPRGCPGDGAGAAWATGKGAAEGSLRLGEVQGWRPLAEAQGRALLAQDGGPSLPQEAHSAVLGLAGGGVGAGRWRAGGEGTTGEQGRAQGRAQEGAQGGAQGEGLGEGLGEGMGEGLGEGLGWAWGRETWGGERGRGRGHRRRV